MALPSLEKAVRNMALDPGDQPLVIADYGSSQGKNSLAPIRVAIRILRERTGPSRPIFVFHVDQPSNDFNALFDVLDTDPNRYTKLQAGGAAMALPSLEKAVRNMALEPGDQPVVIADYGSSQGKNSLAPCRSGLERLQRAV